MSLSIINTTSYNVLMEYVINGVNSFIDIGAGVSATFPSPIIVNNLSFSNINSIEKPYLNVDTNYLTTSNVYYIQSNLPVVNRNLNMSSNTAWMLADQSVNEFVRTNVIRDTINTIELPGYGPLPGLLTHRQA